MILTALKQSPKSAGSKFSKDVPEEWTLRQEIFRRRRQSTKYSTGEQWTKELIEFFWTHGNTLWKERCAVVHAPGEDSPDHSSARSRQTAQQRVEMAYAHAPHMLAHDRRVLDVPRKNDNTNH
jgi:hypothetical protein